MQHAPPVVHSIAELNLLLNASAQHLGASHVDELVLDSAKTYANSKMKP
jgi:hypothetical protein